MTEKWEHEFKGKGFNKYPYQITLSPYDFWPSGKVCWKFTLEELYELIKFKDRILYSEAIIDMDDRYIDALLSLPKEPLKFAYDLLDLKGHPWNKFKIDFMGDYTWFIPPVEQSQLLGLLYYQDPDEDEEFIYEANFYLSFLSEYNLFLEKVFDMDSMGMIGDGNLRVVFTRETENSDKFNYFIFLSYAGLDLSHYLDDGMDFNYFISKKLKPKIEELSIDSRFRFPELHTENTVCINEDGKSDLIKSIIWGPYSQGQEDYVLSSLEKIAMGVSDNMIDIYINLFDKAC